MEQFTVLKSLLKTDKNSEILKLQPISERNTKQSKAHSHGYIVLLLEWYKETHFLTVHNDFLYKHSKVHYLLSLPVVKPFVLHNEREV